MKDVIFTKKKPEPVKPILALPAPSLPPEARRRSYKRFYHTLSKSLVERKSGDYALNLTPVM